MVTSIQTTLIRVLKKKWNWVYLIYPEGISQNTIRLVHRIGCRGPGLEKKVRNQEDGSTEISCPEHHQYLQ